MKRNGIIKYNTINGEAVSEAIGAILMISLVVVGVALLSVIIMGQSTPTEIPSLSMIPDTIDTDLLLYHSGGDSLKRGEFFVRVDGTDYSSDDISLINQGGDTDLSWDSWDLGEALEIQGKSDYKQIQIISAIGDQGSLITGSGEAAITYAPTGTSTATATPTPTPTPGSPPVADFTANITSGFASLIVKFTDTSTGGTPDSWSWDFGDTGSSADSNPEHTYTSPGTYDVSLIVSNAGGSDTETKLGYITVDEMPSPPVADFTTDVISGFAPLTVSFTDTSTGGSPDSYSWNFGDGGTSNDPNPEHIYTSPGIYNVSLIISNAGGSDTDVKNDYITVFSFTLAAWWKFDETSGSTAYDSSGNGNDGEIKGNVEHESSGHCDGALYFDGTSTYVLVDKDGTLDAPKYLTYAAWLKPETPEDYGYQYYTSLIDKGKSDKDNYELFISRYGSTSEFTFETYDTQFHDYTTNDFNYEYGQWQHIAFVADTDAGGTAKLYVNGNNVVTVSSSIVSDMKTNNEDLTLGRQQGKNSYPKFYYRGLMDDVMLSTSALTDEQISEIYGSCTPP